MCIPRRPTQTDVHRTPTKNQSHPFSIIVETPNGATYTEESWKVSCCDKGDTSERVAVVEEQEMRHGEKKEEEGKGHKENLGSDQCNDENEEGKEMEHSSEEIGEQEVEEN